MKINDDNKYTDEFFENYKSNYMSSGVTQNKPPVRHTKPPKKSKKPAFRIIAAVLILAVLASVTVIIVKNASKPTPEPKATPAEQITSSEPDIPKLDCNFTKDENTFTFTTQLQSEYGILLDLENKRVVAELKSDEKIYPASLTKIMTLLVAVEHITDYSETFEMTADIVNRYYKANATVAGFAVGEKVNMTDLLYGTILPSGADAAEGLALTIAGSEEKFIELMNDKAAELGLKNTHFCNTSGLHNAEHYTTVSDMAVILYAAINNEKCKEILSTYQYPTEPTPEHPAGILLTSTMFSYMTGEEPETAKILAGKTGFTNEAGNCLASFGTANDTGNRYIFVTAMGHGKWKAVFDHIHIYRDFVK